MNLEIVANLVVAFATASTLLCRMRLNKSIPQKFFKNAPISSAVNSFFKQVELLEDASLNYFNTLNDAGLNDLITIKDQLQQVIMDRDKLIHQGRYDDANSLVEFVNSPNSKPYKKLFELTSAKLDRLENWKDTGQNRIMNCVIQLGISSNRPASTAVTQAQPPISRANRRRATFCTLNELKEIITDRRTLSD